MIACKASVLGENKVEDVSCSRFLTFLIPEKFAPEALKMPGLNLVRTVPEYELSIYVEVMNLNFDSVINRKVRY
jgi:hypothetical protein